jgi:tight adherence protein B
MMSDPLYAGLAAAAAGCALFFTSSAVVSARGQGHRTTISRLGAFTEPVVGEPSQGGTRALRRTSSMDRRLTSMPMAAWLRRDLQRAGVQWHVKDYLVLILLASGIVGLLAFTAMGPGPLVLAGAAGGGIIPVVLVRRAGSQRSARLNAQVVDVVDIIASSLRSGFGFVQAIELAAREQAEPISGALARMIHEINMGVSTEEALERLVARTGDQDLDLVVTAVLIQRRVGGNLAEVLQNISQTIRDRIQVKGQIKTLTAQARMSGWIVGLLPVVLAGFLAVVSPGYIAVLFVDPIGHIMLGVAVMLDIIGFVAIRRISAIDY